MKTPLSTLVALLWLPAMVSAADTVDYVRAVKPLLSRRCAACHGVLKQKAGLRLDTAARIRKGGESGPAIIAGHSGESLLIEAVAGTEGWRMPPEGDPLSAAEITLLRDWIDQGASAPSQEAEPADPRRHWAFLPPRKPELPQAPGTDAAINPVDAFLAAAQRKLGLRPAPLAAKEVLLRRVSLDLTGLAPTPEELRQFLQDEREDAYERVVDRLLASPRYGERWGRHWMDVWRYSDWDGYAKEVRESQPHIWRWRDWIVESLNRDTGYDRMIVAMLAADEAAPDDADAIRATGYLVRNWYKFNRNVWLDNIVEHTGKAFLGITLNCARCHDHKYDPFAQEDYYRFRAFFEPHKIRTDQVPGQADPQKDGLVRIFDADAKTPTFLFARGDEKNPVKDKPLSPGVPRVLAPAELPIREVVLPATAYYPGLRRYVREESLGQARAALESSRAALVKASETVATTRQRVDALLSKDPRAQKLPAFGPIAAFVAGSRRSAQKADLALALAEKSLAAAEAALAATEARLAADAQKYASPPGPDAARLANEAGWAERRSAIAAAEVALLRAEQVAQEAQQVQVAGDKKTEKSAQDAAKKVAEAAALLATARKAVPKPGAYSSIGEVFPATSTGRRLALARWIASKENPLTARVAVNHVWLRHFGTPLVETVFDFGLNGKAPAHAELLDWLAAEFMERGWSMKAIHRTIVTSQAYRRQSSPTGPDDPNLAIDAANRHYWRTNARRMEAEVVRDNLLHAAGTLDATQGGPDLDPDSGQSSRRRSLYFRHAKEKRVTFLKLFDSANATSCYRRSESVVPQQSLALANSPIALEQSRILAASLSREAGPDNGSAADGSFITAAFERILNRLPTSDERAACEAYLADQAKMLADRSVLHAFASGPAATVKPAAAPAQRARESLVHVLFNHNDFVTIR